MRKKIQDLVKGKYEYTRSRLITEQKVTFEVLENESFKGSFSIQSETGERVRGLITCAHPYVDCQVKQFDGASAEIAFEYHAVGIEAGTKDKGLFVIASNCGEYVVPFEASVTRYYHDSSIGKVKTINDLCNLAKLNWEEALKVFQSKFFLDILDEKSKLLYKGLCYRNATGHEMEEFLVGIDKKTRIQFSIDNPMRNYGRVREDIQDIIRVFKSGWGYLDIQISTDCDFIRLQDSHIQASHFTGRDTEITYSILVNRLHAGKNYGSITLKTPFQQHVVELCVQKASELRSDAKEAAKKYNQRTYALLTKKYIDFKLGHFPESVYLRESLELFDMMIERDPSERWNFLLKCHFLIQQDKEEHASWLLEDAAYGCKDKKSPEWCYIQYLQQMIEHKDSRQIVVAADIKSVYQRNKDNLLLFLLLLETDGAIKGDTDFKYAVIKDYLANISCSPVVYYEAYQLLKEEPGLMKNMDDVDIRICYWIGKQNLLDAELVAAILEAAAKVRQFNNRFFWILCRCYKHSKNETCVRIICTYLIVNNKFGEEYLHWFSKGLENKMRVGGICEAYIQSWRRTDGDIPAIVLNYFAKRTVLPAAYKCRLYAYVVRNAERLESLMESYRELIIPFMEEELKKNHMSDELAEICRYVKTQISPDAWRAVHQNCTNIEKVISSNPAFTNIAVSQKGTDVCQKAPIVQNLSYVHLFSEDYQVLFEDGYGYRYFVRDGYRVNKMFPKDWRPMRGDSVQMEEITQAMESNALIFELEELAGTIESLDQHIQEAKATGTEVIEYQEQLLVRMLFTEQFTDNHVEYFREICKQNDTTQLRDAYVSWFSWRYLCWQEDIPAEVFEYLEYSVAGLRTLNRCCELALFKYFCENGLKQEMSSWFAKIFESLLEQGMKLPCFDRLPAEWKRTYFLHDCSYLTYTGMSGKKLFCRLKVTSGGKRILMNHPVLEVTGGYYVLATRMFADEIIDYEFIENIENEEVILASGSAKLTQNYLKNLDGSRYGVLNQALRENQMQFDKLQKYAEMTDMVNHLFQPL